MKLLDIIQVDEVSIHYWKVVDGKEIRIDLIKLDKESIMRNIFPHYYK